MISALEQQRLIIVTGKGGVGKTTVAAALALKSAADGKRTLVCEVNTKERISPLLGHGVVGSEITHIEPNLWAVDVQPSQALKEYALMTLKFERLYNAVFENNLVHYFLRFIPSISELVMLGKILFHVREKRADGQFRFERIVVDAPATGHAISFLSVPQVIIDTVPPGAMAADATWMRDLLVSKETTASVLVALPEELPINEALELHKRLESQVRLHTALMILNQTVDARFDPDFIASTPQSLRFLATHHHQTVAFSRVCSGRLQQAGVPVLELPKRFVSQFGRSSIEALSHYF
jgi:anion-transporting  ArsA/GET3 family ATPase